MQHTELLSRRVAESIDKKQIESRLAAGDVLRVKLGVDPNKPDLHLGHAVPLRKLREFQDAGHTAVIILGDFTAQLGDPSDKSEARILVSAEETEKNAQAYIKQISKILDPSKTEVRRNSEWFKTFGLRDVIELMASTTVNHLLSHETFQKRLDDGQPLYSQEFLYPLMQGYDSVMVNADIELGGVDQKFNLLMGRVVQRAHSQREQNIMLVNYLPGTDGSPKMSKSIGNTINLNDSAEEMFGKTMSIPDALIVSYLSLATDVSDSEVERIAKELQASGVNPRDIKVMLAKAIVSEYHSHDAAEQAEDSFNRTFVKKETPEDVQTLPLEKGDYPLMDILVSRSGLVASRSEARRLITQGGVKVNRVPASDFEMMLSPTSGEEVVIQVGPRRWMKIIWK